MANWQGMQLTKQGRALMAKLMAHENGNIPTVLTRIALGGGILPVGQKLESMTGIIDEHTSLPISSHSIIGNEVVQLETSFKSEDFPQAVKLHEIGVFATDPDIGEILYAYDNATEGDTIPANGGSSAVIRTFRILLQVANAANVSLTIIDDGSTGIWDAIGKVQDNIDAVIDDLATVTTEQVGNIAANAEAVAEVKDEITALATSLSDIAANAVRIATDAEASAGVLETVAVNPKQLVSLIAPIDTKLTAMQNHLIVRPLNVAVQESGTAFAWKTPIDLSAHLPEGAVLFGGYAHMRTTQAGQSTLAVGTDWIEYAEICSTNNLFATAGHFVLATNNQKMYVGNPVVVGGVTEQTIIIKWYASLF